MSEISIAFFVEEYNMKREKATLLNTVIAVFFGTLCALSFGILSDFTIFGMTIFDLFNYVSSNILLPLGGFGFAIFTGWFLDKRIIRKQLTNDGSVRVRVMSILLFCIRYVAPICIAVIFIYGLGLF